MSAYNAAKEEIFQIIMRSCSDPGRQTRGAFLKEIKDHVQIGHRQVMRYLEELEEEKRIVPERYVGNMSMTVYRLAASVSSAASNQTIGMAFQFDVNGMHVQTDKSGNIILTFDRTAKISKCEEGRFTPILTPVVGTTLQIFPDVSAMLMGY